MTSFVPHALNFFVSPEDQAKEAAEECTKQGEDDEFSDEFEYEHPPW